MESIKNQDYHCHTKKGNKFYQSFWQTPKVDRIISYERSAACDKHVLTDEVTDKKWPVSIKNIFEQDPWSTWKSGACEFREVTHISSVIKFFVQ